MFHQVFQEWVDEWFATENDRYAFWQMMGYAFWQMVDC